MAVVGPRGRMLAPYLITAATLLTLYVRTLGPSAGYSSDASKFGYLGWVLGTAHPPGYPLYTMLTAVWMRVVPVGELAWRVNLLSALCGVATCVVLHGALRLVGVGRVTAAAGAVAIGLTQAFWTQSVIAEVYTLNALFIAGTLLGLLAYERSRSDGWLVVALLVYEASFAHHTSGVLLLPGLLVYLAWRRALFLFRPRYLALFLLMGIAVLASYGYLYWRSTDPSTPYVEAEVTNLSSLVATITGGHYTGGMFAVPHGQLLEERLPDAWSRLLTQLGWVLPLTIYGLMRLTRRLPLVGVVTVLWAALEFAFAVSYTVFDWYTFLFPSWLLMGVWTAVGLDGLVRGLTHRWTPAACLAVLLPVGLLLVNHDHVDRSGDVSTDEVRAAIQAVTDDSVIFVPSYEVWHQFNYVLFTEGALEQRNIFAVKQRPHDADHSLAAYYCTTAEEAVDMPRLESFIRDRLNTGRQVYIFGVDVARGVESEGLRVAQSRGSLYRVECPSMELLVGHASALSGAPR